MQKNILFVNHTATLGGAEISLLTLIERLDRTKFTPHIAMPLIKCALCERLAQAGAVIHDVPMKRLRRTKNPFTLLGYVINWRRAINKICRIIRYKKIDLVHANSTTAMLFASPAAEKTRAPIVWHVRDIAVPNEVLLSLTRKASAIVAVSEASLRYIRGDARRKTRIIHNGVDTNKFAPGDGSSFRKLLGIPPGAPVAGMMAQFVPWKGHKRFIDAAALVAKAVPDAHFIIAGDDSFGDFPKFKDDLRQYANALALGDKTHFTGWVDDAPALLNALDVLAVASDMEPFGRVIIEAMACGKPVVAFKAGGPVEIIDHGKTGLLAKLLDPEDLAEQIAKLLSDKPAASAMGAAGRTAASERFSAELYATKIQALYAELLSV